MPLLTLLLLSTAIYFSLQIDFSNKYHRVTMEYDSRKLYPKFISSIPNSLFLPFN